MSKYKDFYWTVCDGSLYYICKNRDSILIPNEYAYLIDERLIPIENDEYKVKILLNDGEYHEKYIFGFNTIETYNEILAKNDERILNAINKINSKIKKINEDNNPNVTYDKYEAAHRIINVFYDERCEVTGCFSKELRDILKNNIKTLEEYIINNPSGNKVNLYKLSIENGNDVLDSSTVLNLYKL